jgi:hypothetical protein
MERSLPLADQLGLGTLARRFPRARAASLRQALSAAPDFVKPNRNEASDFTGHSINSPTTAVEATPLFFNAGAKSVAISLGADGMVWQRAASCDAFVSEPLPLKDCFSVGCGDAAVNVWGLYRVEHDGSLTAVQLHKLDDLWSISKLIDVDNDGEPELIGSDWLGLDTIVIRGSGDELERLSLAFFGCPC